MQLLGQPVADHALGLGAEGIEWIGPGQCRVVLALDRQEPDLGAVAVAKEQLTLGCKRRECCSSSLNVVALDGGIGPVVAFE